jgi:DNA-binding protein HU-beta
VNKAELIKAVEDRLQSDRKTAQQAVDHVVDVIVRSVAKGEKVAITGFGVFEKRRRGARTARNPKTGAAVKVKATSVPAFRAGSGFKEVVSGAKKLEKLVKSTASAATKKATPQKSTATKKSAAAKTLAKKSPAKSPAAKTAAAKTLAKKSPAKKAAAKTTAAKRTAKKATKTAAKKTTTAVKTAKKAVAKKAPAKKSS